MPNYFLRYPVKPEHYVYTLILTLGAEYVPLIFHMLLASVQWTFVNALKGITN
jgi:hypothetical protein